MMKPEGNNCSLCMVERLKNHRISECECIHKQKQLNYLKLSTSCCTTFEKYEKELGSVQG